MGTLGISQVTATSAQQPVQQAVKVVRGSYLDEKIAEEEILRMTGKEKLSDLIHNDDNQIKKNIKNNKTSNQKKNTQKDSNKDAPKKAVIVMQQNPSQNLDLNFKTRNHVEDYQSAKLMTGYFGIMGGLTAAGLAFLFGDMKTDNIKVGIKLGLKVGAVAAAITGGIWKYFDYKENQEHLKIHNQVTHNKLTQVFCKNGSDGGARITYDEQCQIREMVESKNSIFSKFSPKSNERYNLEEYYNKMIDQFSSPESEDGERITYFEQCQLNEIASNRADLL